MPRHPGSAGGCRDNTRSPRVFASVHLGRLQEEYARSVASVALGNNGKTYLAESGKNRGRARGPGLADGEVGADERGHVVRAIVGHRVLAPGDAGAGCA